MRKTAIAVALLALPLLAACSSEDKSGAPVNPVSATTPAVAVTTTAPAVTTTTTSSGVATTSGAPTSGTLTAPQISKSLQDKAGLDSKTADCVAGIYVDEGLSQSGIQKLIDHGYNNPVGIGLTGDDLRKAGTATKRIVTECVR
ncbi:hypothetical protein OHB26_12705 [Nocardia sp. NBC_01503]|uniref:hypothetical protein n=1 Tax=Nocardia sp. NBC_01503 TaxID=2975997 RepID=UPI002E7ACC18|nr:hypothetical protein [Nocardia sp. NBC_01503]WTL34972.1 hypothetical protein OHB26_12705 [Nocardia sp. NBC_01503]